MCGIAGWIAPTRSSPEERLLAPMLSALAHRGPDGAGSVSYLAARGDYRVVLARDRFGEKPLYLHEANGALFFASEMKALLKLPRISREVDLASVWDYLAYRYVPGPRTLFEAIRKLPPATTALWHRGQLQEMRYWTPPDKFARGRTANLTSEETQEAFLGHLSEAVRLQMVSDVPFGAFLSGGLDSSVIVALMTRYCSKVKTF